MSEEENEPRTEDFYADISARLIEGEMLKNNAAKLGLILVNVLDTCLPTDEDSVDVVEVKNEILAQILHELVYHEAQYLPTEEEIDGEIKTFSDWLETATKEPNTTDEEEN
jgi:hypothetical protein